MRNEKRKKERKMRQIEMEKRDGKLRGGNGREAKRKATRRDEK